MASSLSPIPQGFLEHESYHSLPSTSDIGYRVFWGREGVSNFPDIHLQGKVVPRGQGNLREKSTGVMDFPGGPVVKNLPSNAGDMGSIPGRGTKIPHAVGQLSPCTATTEPAHLN